MENKPQDHIKAGSVQPGNHVSEILHETDDGKQVRISAIRDDSDETEVKEATMYIYNPSDGETEIRYGRIRGVIRESSHYVWEHKKQTAAIGSAVVSVVLGSLWVRHRSKS